MMASQEVATMRALERNDIPSIFDAHSMSDAVIDHFGVSSEMTTILRHHQPEGVTLQVLNALVEEFGGKEILRNMSIVDIRDQFLAPRRQQVKGSFLDYLKSKKEYQNGIKQANVFVSYNLGFFFVDFVESLNQCFKDDPEKDSLVLFITTLSNNFNILSPTPGTFPTIGVMTAHITTLVEKFQRTVLVLCQWDDPHRTPFTRLWCLLEMFQAACCQHRLDIATYGKGHIFSNKQTSSSASTSNRIIDDFLQLIDIRNARTFSSEYNEGILGFVDRYIGVDRFNETVTNFIVQHNQSKIERLTAARHSHMLQAEEMGSPHALVNDSIKSSLSLETCRPSLVLDLDDTLYPGSKGIMNQISKLNDEFLQKQFHLNPDDHCAILQMKTQLHQQYGKAASFLLEDSDMIVESNMGDPITFTNGSTSDMETETEESRKRKLSLDQADDSSSRKKPPSLTVPKNIRLTSVLPEDPRLYVEERTTPRAMLSLSRSLSENHSGSSSGFTSTPHLEGMATNPLDYYEYLNNNMDYSVLQPNPKLRDMLQRLSEHVNLVLFSNAHYQHVSRVLTCLDLNNLFDYIIHADFSDVNFPIKPQIEAFERVEHILGLHSRSSLSPSGNGEDSTEILNELRKKIFYVDDAALNVTIAEGRGWQVARIVEDDASRGRAINRGESGIIANLLELEQLDVFKSWLPQPAFNDSGKSVSTPSSSTIATNNQPVDLQQDLQTRLADGSIDGILRSSLGSESITGPECCPPNTVYFEELPEVFTFVTEPYYATIPIPTVVDKVIKGKDKYFNRCVRRGLVKFITCENGFGGFLVKPNPGYHSETSYLIKQVLQKKITAEVIAKVREEEERISIQDPFGETILTDQGFAYVAWWIPPSLVERTQATLNILQLEKERGCIGEDIYETNEGTTPTSNIAQDTIPIKKKLTIPMNKRLKSSVEEVTDYGLSNRDDETTVRDIGYLHTMKSLTKRDLPLLEALRREAWPWLESTFFGVSISPENCGFHYPYTDFFSTLHIHIRGTRFPHEEDHKVVLGSGQRPPGERGMYVFDDILDNLRQHGSLGSRMAISGCLTKKMLNWFDKLKANAPFAYEKLEIQTKDIETKDDTVVNHSTKIMVVGQKSFNNDKVEMLKQSSEVDKSVETDSLEKSTAAEVENTLPLTDNSDSLLLSRSTTVSSDESFSSLNSDEIMLISPEQLFAEWMIRAHESSNKQYTSSRATTISAEEMKQAALRKALLSSFDDGAAMSLEAYQEHLASIRVVAVVGAPGIGKNTTLAPLCATRRWIHLSSGDLMRSLEREGSSVDQDRATIGHALKSLTEKAKHTAPGALRDRYWDRIFHLMTIFIAKYFMLIPKNSVVILDNYPRTVSEFTSLMKIGINFMAYIEVTLKDSQDPQSIQKLVDRMTSRGRGSIDKDVNAARKRVLRYFQVVVPDIEKVVSEGNKLWLQQQHSQLSSPFPFHRILLTGDETPSILLEQLLKLLDDLKITSKSSASSTGRKLKKLPASRVFTA